LHDNLPPAEQVELNGHLEICPDCQRTLEECAANRASWADAPRYLGQPGPTRDQALRDVMDRLKTAPHAADEADDDPLPLDFLDPSDRPGSLGRLGPYEILEEIGRGGMGVVFKALDPALHRVVAIKVLAPQLAASGTARKRFTREARAAAAIAHEHVVTIHAVEEFKGLPYLVMHYVAGPSLAQKIADGGPLPVAEVLRIGQQTAAGLAAAHAQGLIHRDVKPANILLENGVERVKLTDFSLARAIDDASVTQSGVVTGTPQYMAPEQARGEALDARADLFSLGSVLYTLCTGRPPFRGGHPLEVLRKVSDDTPTPIRELTVEVPAWLAAIIERLMAKKPADRFASAAEVSGLLERCLAHVQQPTAVPLPPIPGAPRPPRRWGGWLTNALPILAGVFVVVAVTVLRLRTPDGTLEITIDDPQAKVAVDGTDIVVTGAGVQEFRLKAGSYTTHQTKDGKAVKTEIVSIKQGEKTPLKVTFEPDAGTPAAKSSDAAAYANLLEQALLGHARSETERAKAVAAAEKAAADLAAAKARAAEMGRHLADLELRKQQLLQTLGPNHPQIKELQDTITWNKSLYADQARAAAAGDKAELRADQLQLSQRSLPTEAGEVSSAAFSPDGKQLFVADWNGSVYGYDFATGKTRFTVAAGMSGGSRFLAVSPDGTTLAAAGTDQRVRLLDLKTGRSKQLLDGKAAPYYAVTFTADGKTLAAGGCGPDGRGGFLELWDLASGTARLVKFADPVQSLAIPPGREDRLAVGTGGEKVRMVYPSSAKEEYPLPQPGPVRALAFSPDGRWLAASGGAQAHLWDWQSGREVAVLTGQAGRVTTIQFSPDGKQLLTASLDGTAKLWDVAAGKLVAMFAPGTHKTGMGVALFTPDGKSIVTAGDDGMIRAWSIPGSDPRIQPAAPPAPAAKPGEKRLRIEIRDKPWRGVFEWLSDQTGEPVSHTSTPPGTLTFSSPQGSAAAKDGYTIPEVIDILNDALLAQKYLLIRREGGSFTVVPADEKLDPTLVPRVRIEDLKDRGRTEIVMIVLPLKAPTAKDLVPTAKKLLGPFGEVTALTDDRLLLQDTAGNLRRLVETLDAIKIK
jgi:serine/threonine protein kinase